MKRNVISILLLFLSPAIINAIPLSNDRGIILEINPITGDISSITFKNIKVLEGADELWTFESEDGNKFIVSSWKNRIHKFERQNSSINITIINSFLNQKNISISERYFWEKDILIKRVELTNNGKKDVLLRTVSKTRFTDKIGQNSFYYIPYGSYCVKADQINQQIRVKNHIYSGIKNQMIALYNRPMNILAASFVYRVNGKFTTIFSGWDNPSYLKNGWAFASCLSFIKPGQTISYDIAYYVSTGAPSKLIRRWIELDEIQKKRKIVWKNVKIPEWFKNVALVGFVYTPIQIEANHFLPNVKPLAKKLPGNWMIIQWGSSHRALDKVKGYFKGYGQPVPPQCEDIRWAVNDLPKIRKEIPNIKIGNYRYYWSMDDGSPEGVMHPEWRLTDRQGKPVYAGTIHRYARNPLIPQAVESCVFTTREWYTYIPVDFHYVDGTDGAYPAWVGWRQKATPQWYDWHELFLKVYKLVHSDLITPSVLFCNGAPVSCGDAGFIEIGGNNKNIWQGKDGWRGLADRCEMGRLWGPPQGFMCLLFWDRRTDLRYINHVLAYGLVPNLSPGGAKYTGSENLDFCLARLPYIKEAYKIRNSKLVYPDLKPDWRADGGDIEAVMLKTKSDYRINVINHSEKTRNVKITFNPQKIGLAEKNITFVRYQLIKPNELIKTKSDNAFRKIESWQMTLPEDKSATFTLKKVPADVLTTIVMK